MDMMIRSVISQQQLEYQRNNEERGNEETTIVFYVILVLFIGQFDDALSHNTRNWYFLELLIRE